MGDEIMSGEFFAISFAGTMYWYVWPAIMGGTAFGFWLRTRVKGALLMGVGLLMGGLFVAVAHNVPSTAIENYTGDPKKLFEAMKPVNQELLLVLTLGIQFGFVMALIGFVWMSIHIAKRWETVGGIR